MDANQIVRFLRELKCTKIKTNRPGWVEATCPLAKWQHSGGVDKNPSFAVRVNPGGISFCRCLACGAKGDLRTLLDRLRLRYKVDCTRLYSILQSQNVMSSDDADRILDLSIKRAKGLSYGFCSKPAFSISSVVTCADLSNQYQDDIVGIEAHNDSVPEISNEELTRFKDIPDDVRMYLNSDRHLTDETIQKWELGWHPGARRIVLPIRDYKQRLVGISGRKFGDGKKSYLHSKGFRKDYFLYGEHFLVDPVPQICVVEGFFDAMYLSQCGFVAVAVMGSYMGRIQAEKLCHYTDNAIVIPDGDDAGYKLGQRVLAELQGRIWVRVVPLPAGKDPDDLSQDELDQLIRS